MVVKSPSRDELGTNWAEAPRQPGWLTLTELAYLAGTSPRVIEQLLEWDVMVPCRREPEPCFSADTLPLVRKLLRLHAGLGIDFPSLPLVLDLLERIDGLEKRLSELESRRQG
jgi:hypothetical protein